MNRTSLEPLESRRLLAGVTLVTHGFQPNQQTPAWTGEMADAIADRVGGASIYRLVVGPTGTQGVAQVQSFARVSTGPAHNAQAVIELDWSSVSNFLSNPVYTGQVASLVLPYLLNTQSLPGDPLTVQPLAQLPIHLAGHSRGASLVSDLARRLGESGVWVDDLTIFDGFPVQQDPAISVFDNVVFADNYYETTDFIVHGSPITGAHNVLLNGLSGMNHSATHTYYHGTIDRAATSADGVAIPASWYASPSTGPRYAVGYDWSEFGRQPRPNGGVGTAFGGSAARSTVNVTAAQPWPDVTGIQITAGAPSGSIANGNALTLSYRYKDLDGDDTVSFWLDADTNPFNGNERPLGSETVAASAPGAAPVDTFVTAAWSSAGIDNGLYHLLSRITDTNGHARHDYATASLSVDPSGARVINRQFSANINGQWTNPSNWTPGGTPTLAERVALTGTTVTVPSNAAAASADVHGGSLSVSVGALLDTALHGSGNASVSFASTQRLRGLSLLDTATLNVNNHGLLLSTNATYESVAALIASARNFGAWDGPGLTSSAAAGNPSANTTLGVLRGSDYLVVAGASFNGFAVSASDVVVKYTYYGDSDFNGVVDGDDYARADNGFNLALTDWFAGDFDLNGLIDGDDYSLLDAAFNTQSAPL
jgi:hypothetical protein